MRVASIWADKYVEQGMSQTVAKSTAYLLLLLVFRQRSCGRWLRYWSRSRLCRSGTDEP